MSTDEIEALKIRAGQGGVYWRDHDGVCRPVDRVKLDWVEFPDEPELTESAALLIGGGAVALVESCASEFVTMAPALSS